MFAIWILDFLLHFVYLFIVFSFHIWRRWELDDGDDGCVMVVSASSYGVLADSIICLSAEDDFLSLVGRERDGSRE